MSVIQPRVLIDIKLFNTCLINNTEKHKIIELYPTRKHGAYYLNKFSNFLKDNFKITLKEYCIKYLNINWPKCPISNEDVGYKIDGKGINLSNFKKGKLSKEFCPKFKEYCNRISLERIGVNNPMFGATPWNKGKTKYNNEIIKKISNERIGFITPESVKIKQSKSAKLRKIHGHTGHKHSEDTIKKLRENTSRLWASGRFNRETSIHKKMREFLLSLNLKEQFKEEFQVKYFSMDFAFPNAKVAIECQGQFFHVDPRIYPNGPINEIQKRNFGRDKAKKSYCSKLGWTIIEAWESEINNGLFKENIICELSKLNLLNQ